MFYPVRGIQSKQEKWSHQLKPQSKMHCYASNPVFTSDKVLTVSRHDQSSIISLWITPDDFIRQRETSCQDRVKDWALAKSPNLETYLIIGK